MNTIKLFLLVVILMTPYTKLTSQKKIKDPKATEQWTPVPVVTEPGDGTAPPSDAIILLGDGDDLSMWESKKGGPVEWDINAGVLTITKGKGAIRTRNYFGDCQLHLEWRSPAEVKGNGQGRGNSGVFLMEKYEVQVLDSYNNRTYSNGMAASIYKQHVPLVNACRPPGEWQTYDIIWKAPVFNNDSTVKSPAFVTVIHNGVIVQNHVELKGPTEFIGIPEYKYHADRLPIEIQDHGNPVSFRNIWIREL